MASNITIDNLTIDEGMPPVWKKNYESEKKDRDVRRRLILRLGCTRIPSLKFFLILNFYWSATSNLISQFKHRRLVRMECGTRGGVTCGEQVYSQNDY